MNISEDDLFSQFKFKNFDPNKTINILDFDSILEPAELDPPNKGLLDLIEGYGLTSVAILGLIGTSMSIGVLVQPAARESFSSLLTGLAFCDAFFLLTSLVVFGLPKLWLWFAHKVTKLMNHKQTSVPDIGNIRQLYQDFIPTTTFSHTSNFRIHRP